MAKHNKQTGAQSKSSKKPGAQARVRRALYELLHNPYTPAALFDRCAQFVCDQSNEGPENIFHSNAVLTELLKAVPDNELRCAVTESEARNV